MPRLPLAILRRIVPGAVGESLALEIAAAHAQTRAESGRLHAAVECWREVLSPAVWRLRRELNRPALPGVRGSNIPAGDPPLSRLVTDIRFAVRGLLARPAFTVTAVLIIAVGIGVSTVIFTVVDHVLLRQLPFDEPEKLVAVDDPSFPLPLFRRWQEETRGVFEHFGAAYRDVGALTGGTVPSEVSVGLVTPEFFPALRVVPALGRGFGAEEHSPSAEVVLISHGAWQRIFGGDPEIVGREIQLNQAPRTIVGVLPAAFEPPELVVGTQVDVWLPMSATEGRSAEDWGSYFIAVVARLRPDQTVNTATPFLDDLSDRLLAENPGDFDEPSGVYQLRITPLLEATVGGVGQALYLLLGAVGLMLLIACANVASLLLARSTERHQEIAVRAALGAGRFRLVQQLITEALVLSLAGGAIGIAAAFGAVEWFNQTQPGAIPRTGAVALDLRVLAAALGVTVVTGLLFGVLPAWRTVRSDLTEAIRDGSGTVSGSATRQRLRSGLVVVEVALAVVLTVGAGLLFGSFLRMTAVDPGFDTDELVSLRLGLGTYTTEERPVFVQQTAESLRAIPGVDSVGIGITVPFAITGSGRCCWFDRMLTDEDDPGPHLAVFNPVDEGYFATLRARLRHGRAIEPADDAEDPVAVLTLGTARAMFGRDDVVGEVLAVDGDLDLRIVGVVDDIRHWGLTEPPDNAVYVPYRAFNSFFPHVNFLVRGARADLPARIREAIWAVDSQMPVDNIVAMRQRVAESVATPRFYSSVFAIFSVVALLLAAGGVYGTLMFQVGQRRREIGIRMALGARWRDVVRGVVGRGLALTGLGLLIGLGTAVAMSRVMESLVFGMTATDPTTFVVVAAVLLGVALLASYLPARRAGSADPASTLRSQ